MCYAYPYNKRVQLTVEKHPELVTDWYKRHGRYGVSVSLAAKALQIVTPKVIEWFESTGFDVEFRASMDQCHLSIIFDDDVECKLFRMAFGC